MNVNFSTNNSSAQQFLTSLNKQSNQNACNNVVSSLVGNSTTSVQQQRFPLGLNNNLVNIGNNNNNNSNSNNSGANANLAVNALRNIQLSPNSAKQLNAKIGLNLFTATTNASSSTSSSNSNSSQPKTSIQAQPKMSNYPTINISNQLSYLNQQQQSQQQQQQQQQANNTTLLAAATLLAANSNQANLQQTLNSIYQQHQQPSTCNLNNTLFVGNLHASLQEIDLIQVFRPFGRIVECCKKWLHFGFVKFTTEEEACHAYVTLNGFRLKGRPMRLEFQNRSKKAKIKAILAQAALQVANGSNNGSSSSNGQSICSIPSTETLLSMGNLAVSAGANSYHDILYGSSSFGNQFNSSITQAQQQQQEQFGNLHSLLNDERQFNQNSFFQSQQQYQHESTANSTFSSNYTTKTGFEQTSTLSASSLFNTDEILKFVKTNGGLTGTDDKDLLISSNGQIPDINFELINENGQNFAEFANELNLKLDENNFHSAATNQATPNYNLLDVNYNQNQYRNDDIVLSLIKNTISPAESPRHDTSSSLSTDSGCCRSNSFLNDEDSAICMSIQTTTTSSVNSKHSDEIRKENGDFSSSNKKKSIENPKKSSEDFGCNTISEHLEFTCSNKSPFKLDHEQIGCDEEKRQNRMGEDDQENENDADCSSSDCDTSVDASDIPDEHSTTSDCLNDLDLDELTNECNLNESVEQQLAASSSSSLLNVASSTSSDLLLLPSLAKHSQVVEKDGTILRKKLNSGIYMSINQSSSLFIEPHDILKKVELDEFDAYSLFPNGRGATATDGVYGGGSKQENLADFVDSWLTTMKNQFYINSLDQ